MVWVIGPTEYKVVARWLAPGAGSARIRWSVMMVYEVESAARRVGLGMLRVKARAGARPLRGLRP
jgi:hypothetical protein